MSNPAEPVTALGNGIFRVRLADGRHAMAWGATDGPRTWVFLDGRTYVVEPPQARRSAAVDDAAALAAPMPATVVQVHVAPGDAVSRGDVLVTLEAMKMELPIAAPRDGRVTSISCTQGELVQPGVPLVELE